MYILISTTSFDSRIWSTDYYRCAVLKGSLGCVDPMHGIQHQSLTYKG